MVKQISVFLENKIGRLAEITKVLGENNINIRALSIADTTDFGILRLIVDNPKETYDLLKANGLAVSETEVIAVEIPDTPGGLASVISVINEAGINIEYLYAFLEKTSLKAVVLLKVEAVELAKQVLAAQGINMLTGNAIYQI